MVTVLPVSYLAVLNVLFEYHLLGPQASSGRLPWRLVALRYPESFTLLPFCCEIATTAMREPLLVATQTYSVREQR